MDIHRFRTLGPLIFGYVNRSVELSAVLRILVGGAVGILPRFLRRLLPGLLVDLAEALEAASSFSEFYPFCFLHGELSL